MCISVQTTVRYVTGRPTQPVQTGQAQQNKSVLTYDSQVTDNKGEAVVGGKYSKCGTANGPTATKCTRYKMC